MLFRSVSQSRYGLGGYTTDIKDRAVFEHKMISKIMHSVYRFFLSPEEIESVLMNKTIWLDADEITERLSYMQEKLQEEFEEEMDKMQSEILGEEETSKPKKKKVLQS